MALTTPPATPSAPPTAPVRTELATFAARADAAYSWLFVTLYVFLAAFRSWYTDDAKPELEALQTDVAANQSIASAAAASALASATVNGTSTTTRTPAVASMTWTYTQTDRTPVEGMYLAIVSRANPTTNWGRGTVTAFDSGTEIVTVSIATIGGAPASAADWNIFLEGALALDGAHPGQVVETAAALSSASYLPCDGTVYAQATYPALFAAIGLRPTMTFSGTTMPASSAWKLAFGGGKFVAIGTGTNAAWSVDGLQWTASSMSASGAWTKPAYGNGLFVSTVAASGTVAASSPDGITWTARTMPTSTTWGPAIFGGGMFVATVPSAAATTNAASSPDGITWTARTMPSSDYWTPAYGGGMFIATTRDNPSSTSKAASSPDGITWTARTLPSSGGWGAAAWGGGVWSLIESIAASPTTKAASSPDGITWTARTMPSSRYWGEPVYGNGLFVVNVADTANVVATSPDGITYTERTLPSTDDWRYLTYANGMWTLMAQNSTAVCVSTDGITWSAYTQLGTAAVNQNPGVYGNGVVAYTRAAAASSAMTLNMRLDYNTSTSFAVPVAEQLPAGVRKFIKI